MPRKPHSPRVESTSASDRSAEARRIRLGAPLLKFAAEASIWPVCGIDDRSFPLLLDEDLMPKTLKIELTEDEAEIIIDALEADLEGYVEAAKDARANRNRDDVATFTEASNRISAALAKVRAVLA